MDVEKPPATDSAAVLAALDEIVGSAEFGRAERPARFLRHLVETALRGENHRLKESVVGVEVFGRPASWDPRLDAIVRQEAARLRKRLARYYGAAGEPAAVRIELPVGTYVPVFRSAPEPAETVTRERVPEIAAPPRAAPRRRGLYAAAVVFCLAGVLLGGWFLFHVSSRVGAITAAKSGSVISGRSRSHVANPIAHDLVMKGRFDLQPATTDGVRRAEADFQRAIDIDPDYAQAYLELATAKLAEAGARGSIYRTELERDSAEELARKALQLDPNLPGAHAVLANLAMEYDWDWSRAERELRLALAGPPSAKAELSYAAFLIFQRRFAEADQHLRRAQELEPFDTSTMLGLSGAWYLEGRFAQVREISQRLLALHPNLVEAQASVAGSHIWEGEPELALAALQRIKKPFPALPFYEAMARARAGQHEQALRLIRPYVEKYPNPGAALQWIAKVYAMLGDEPNTVLWLERSADRREWQALTIAVNPVFAPMENSAGFRALKKRMGLE